MSKQNRIHATKAGCSASPISTGHSPLTFHSDSGSAIEVDSKPAGSIHAQVTQLLAAPGFLRVSQIIGDPRSNPPKPPIIPISKSGWWLGIKNGIYPKGIKLSPRVTVWRTADILALIANSDRGARA